MKNEVLYWHDGSPIRSKRVQDAYRRGILTRRFKYECGSVHYFARCSEPGCQNEYNFTQTNTRQAQLAKCAEHAVGTKLVHGEPSRSKKVLNAQQDVFFTRQKSKGGREKRIPWVRCATPTCDRVRQLDSNVTGIWYCVKCMGSPHRLRPFESIYTALSKEIARRSKSLETVSDLTYEQFADICETQKQCHYCNRTVKRTPYRVKMRGSGSGAWCLDRLDSKKGYTVKNVVTCCSTCNWTKNLWLCESEMLAVASIRSGDIDECLRLLSRADTRTQIDQWVAALKTMGVGGQSLKRTMGVKLDAPVVRANKSRLRPFEGIYNQFLLQIKPRGIKNELSYASFRHICETQLSCFYCDKPVSRTKHRSKGYSNAAFLDRIDNRHPYHLDNVVTCCGTCNLTRQRWISFAEMQIIGAIRAGKVEKVRPIFDGNKEALEEWACMMRVFTPQMMHFWLTGGARPG